MPGRATPPMPLNEPCAMMQQRVDERVFLVAGGGMHDESGGFVDHQQRFVLEQNIERDFLRLRLGGSGFRPVDFNLFARARRVRGLDGLAVDADVALFDEPLQRAARGGGKFCRAEKCPAARPAAIVRRSKISVREGISA